MSTKGGTLLIVDDEQDLVNVIKQLLEDQFNNILTAFDGEEALARLKENKIDIVITDINMPKLSGIDFIRKAREEGFDMPFIVFTGHGNREMLLEIVQYGIFDFLNKPHLRGLEEATQNAIKSNTIKSASALDPNDLEALLEKVEKKS